MNKRKKIQKTRIILIFFLIVIVGLTLPLKPIDGVRNYFWQGIKPLGYGFKKTIGQVFPFIKDMFQLKRIVKQNTILVNENLDLQSKLAKLSEVRYENEILKKELGFAKSQDLEKTIPAAIVGQSNGYLKSVVIDKGLDENIAEGDAVVSQGVLIGVVTSVRKDNSEVTLITDFNSLVPALLQDSRGTGLLRGGLLGLSVEEIPLNINIKKGETVVTSGLGGQIPQGILIGNVTDIVSKEGEIFQKVSLSSPVDFSRLEVVFVIKKL